MVAVELEVLAKKYDRFGWDRDRGSAAHDRAITDFMDALQDFPLDEIKAACREAVLDRPSKMPNEGHIVSYILKARGAKLARLPKIPKQECKPDRERATPEQAAAIVAKAGFIAKKFGGRS